MNKILLAFALLFTFGICEIGAQNVDSLKARQSELKNQISSLESELKSTTAMIPPTFGWRYDFSGTVGFSLSSLDNWTNSPNPNSVTSSIQASLTGRANLREEKYFWRNTAQLNLGWQKLDLKRDDVEDESKYQPTVDVLQVTSLFGYRLTPKISLSALAEFRTRVIDNAFDPAFLDLGIGATWIPNENLVVTVHPLNYNFIFASDESQFESSLGAKLLVDYTQDIIEGVRLRSNLTGFMSYEDMDELSNFTWTTGINFTAFKGIGVGIEYALRWNKQETRLLEDDIQQYFLIGLSYSL